MDDGDAVATANDALSKLLESLYELAKEATARDFGRLALQGTPIDPRVDGAITRALYDREPPEWYSSITAVFDVAFCLDKVARARDLIHVEHDGPSLEQGARLAYDADNWFTEAHALCEKSSRCFAVCYRELLCRFFPDWSNRLALHKDAARPGRTLAAFRTAVAHPVSIAVRAMERHRQWEGSVLLGTDIDETRRAYYEWIASQRADWSSALARHTDRLLDGLSEHWHLVAADVHQAARMVHEEALDTWRRALTETDQDLGDVSATS